VSTSQLGQYLEEEHFAPGSMKPKIEAILSYLSATEGNRALVTNPPNIAKAMRHETGYVDRVRAGNSEPGMNGLFSLFNIFSFIYLFRGLQLLNQLRREWAR
jgi:hypothetical protein